MSEEDEEKSSGLSANLLRLFIAVELPPDVKTSLLEFQERLKRGAQFTGAHPTWIQPQNLHLTLAFLGDQKAQCIPPISDAMRTAAAATNGFSLRLKGLELFPNPKAPKVLSIEVQGQVQKLMSMQQLLVEQLEHAGFKLETRPFRPHLTLARIKSAKGVSGLRDLARSHSAMAAGEFEVPDIVLFQSTLSSEGPTYTALARHSFGESNKTPVREP